jgi:CheY-like chemotaxis protein
MDMSPQQQNAPDAHILIVDDTPVNQRQLSQELARRGYETRSVPDGPQVLTKRNGQRERMA